MSITQKGLAEKLGISRQLVSFALNNYPGVAEETRQRVISVARELGYNAFANQGARALIARRYGRRAATGIVAILLPPKFDVPLRDIPNFSHTLDAMEREADRRGLDVLFCRNRNEQLPRLIQSLSVDGVACVSSDPRFVRQIGQLGLPALNVGLQSPGVCWISPDDRQGLALATRHLIDLRHREIAYLGHCTNVKNASERLAGYKQALKAAGIRIRAERIEATVSELSIDAGAAAMERLLERDEQFVKSGKPSFTAIAAYNDLLGMGAVKCLRAHGLDVPRDMSITGFDDVSSQYPHSPRITSINYSRAEMGTRAITMLCENEGSPLEPSGLRLPVTLVLHESCKPLANSGS
ncbi:MAG TPA: LacI family DNA-binding transcriptional regulator [Planctomycetota bacterium]|nr:LacI family DNA-binding transcriptional regulator [Planctomycetota bacterium]